MRLFCFGTGCWLVVFLLSMGCQQSVAVGKNQKPTVTASGVVTFNGKPLGGATLILEDATGVLPSATGHSNEQGQFEFRAYPNVSGAVVGKYVLTVQKVVQKELPANIAHDQLGNLGDEYNPKNVLPAHYADPSKSGLEVEVPQGGSKTIQIELKE